MIKTRQAPEFQQQCALFNWSALFSRTYPELKLLRGSMNGVKLTAAQAGKAKAAGMLKGEHDVTLPVRRGRYIGLSIELKHGDNRPTKEQLDYGAALEEEGWFVTYCWSWTEAADVIQKYLKGEL